MTDDYSIYAAFMMNTIIAIKINSMSIVYEQMEIIYGAYKIFQLKVWGLRFMFNNKHYAMQCVCLRSTDVSS